MAMAPPPQWRGYTHYTHGAQLAGSAYDHMAAACMQIPFLQLPPYIPSCHASHRLQLQQHQAQQQQQATAAWYTAGAIGQAASRAEAAASAAALPAAAATAPAAASSSSSSSSMTAWEAQRIRMQEAEKQRRLAHHAAPLQTLPQPHPVTQAVGQLHAGQQQRQVQLQLQLQLTPPQQNASSSSSSSSSAAPQQPALSPVLQAVTQSPALHAAQQHPHHATPLLAQPLKPGQVDPLTLPPLATDPPSPPRLQAQQQSAAQPPAQPLAQIAEPAHSAPQAEAEELSRKPEHRQAESEQRKEQSDEEPAGADVPPAGVEGHAEEVASATPAATAWQPSLWGNREAVADGGQKAAASDSGRLAEQPSVAEVEKATGVAVSSATTSVAPASTSPEEAATAGHSVQASPEASPAVADNMAAWMYEGGFDGSTAYHYVSESDDDIVKCSAETSTAAAPAPAKTAEQDAGVPKATADLQSSDVKKEELKVDGVEKRTEATPVQAKKELEWREASSPVHDKKDRKEEMQHEQAKGPGSVFDKVLGKWMDQDGSVYEVFLDVAKGGSRIDPSTAKTCSVRTTRVDGSVKHTPGLLGLMRQARNGERKIKWQDSYVLEEPEEARPSVIKWTSTKSGHRRGKPFMWTRLKDPAASPKCRKASGKPHQPEEEDLSDTTSDQPEAEAEPEGLKFFFGRTRSGATWSEERTWRPATRGGRRGDVPHSGLTWRPVEKKEALEPEPVSPAESSSRKGGRDWRQQAPGPQRWQAVKR
eukprot:TRINITY_DN121060_c0_g1_i1.p1 TRINITY_DN121060_c0_g1~~TRINITY_DN121060_c0_g1_i1.p1  ORF type:complete len:760 (-),score=192.80 TRINITY_DN121060_c0_g1_i1:168-2447(-)